MKILNFSLYIKHKSGKMFKVILKLVGKNDQI